MVGTTNRSIDALPSAKSRRASAGPSFRLIQPLSRTCCRSWSRRNVARCAPILGAALLNQRSDPAGIIATVNQQHCSGLQAGPVVVGLTGRHPEPADDQCLIIGVKHTCRGHRGMSVDDPIADLAPSGCRPTGKANGPITQWSWGLQASIVSTSLSRSDHLVLVFGISLKSYAQSRRTHGRHSLNRF
jgi:hypothetical protein